MRNYFGIGFLAFGFLMSLAAAEERLKVFVLSGQSNMVGKRARVESTPADLLAPQPKVLLFTGSSWEPLSPAVSGWRHPKTPETPQGYGPEITFGRDMSAYLGQPIGIIKYAESATNLAETWNPKMKRSYPKLVELVKKAQATRPIEIVGMLWMQGEQDAKVESEAQSYGQNLNNLIEATRADFSNPNMPFVVGRVNPDPDKYPFLALVRTGQESCKLPNYSWVDCDPLSKVADKIHYDTAGIQQLGTLFAQAMQKLMDKKGQPQKTSSSPASASPASTP